ncbi:MAG: acyl--CoA ligase [Methylotenera sp.]|nr:acyl--CoA ligase [Oligoflexia bacterium]
MNCAIRFVEQAQLHPDRLALWTEKHGVTSFAEIHALATRAQAMLRDCGVGPGTPVVIAELPGPALFATLLALLSLGAPILFVEPWLPIERIEHVILTMKPQVFFTGLVGKLWGLRVPAIRKIPHWKTAGDLLKYPAAKVLSLESVEPTSPAVIAFSSGTTGKPKGSVRTQGYLWEMHEILVRYGETHGLQTPDLALFPNVALFQLGTGRGALLVPGRWHRNPKHLMKLASLPKALQPQSVTCGPGFLRQLLRVPGFESLRTFHVGGALTDRWIFEGAFSRWKDAEFTHIYGGSEAEPVALSDARTAVAKSAEKGLFQTLYLGRPVDIIQADLQPDTVWVSGPNVSPEYLGDPKENIGIKRRDETGRLWHAMGDRVIAEPGSLSMSGSGGDWWYAGRQFQKPEEFALEQKIYSRLQNSAAFIKPLSDGTYALLGEPVLKHAPALRKEFPELSRIEFTRITRDRRHHARVDRKASLPKGFKP